MNFREMTKEQLAEESLIDLAYAMLEERKSAIVFADLVKELQTLVGLTDEEIKSRLVQFYTDMNVDGRFLLNHESGWGLREWYKVEIIEEETAPTVKARKKKAKVAEDEEEIEDLEEDDIIFEEDFDEFSDDDAEADVDADELEFVEEEIEDLDAEIDEDLIVEDDEEFAVEDDEEDEDFDDLEDKK